MNHAVALVTVPETKWTVVKGPMKGVVRLLNHAQFSIGRSTECEFVIVNDPKCSRKHAVVTVGPEGCEVTSQNDKNPILLNGREIEKAILKDGDIITLGDTEIQFNAAVRPFAPSHVMRPTPLQQVGPGYARPAAPASRGRAVPQTKSAAPRLLIYFALAIAGLFLLTPSKQKKKTLSLRDEQQIQADIEAANKLKEAADAAALKRVEDSSNARQAQENYIRGFRDYKKGQFERSLISFQACLALNPQHVLCNRYIRLAQRRFDELVQVQMILGRKYRDQNQFKACRASFRNVMVMVKDSNSPTFQEAKSNYEACNALVEGRY